ncbi:KHG/KDPG aldolase [compost metagenome]
MPLFYADDASASIAILRTLYLAGIRVLEYTNRGVAALENFKVLRSVVTTEMPDLFLGIGTIRNTSELVDFLSAGADFVVCPVIDIEVGKKVHELDKLWIPGCLTPTEINRAYELKAGIIKLFPANVLGPSFLSAIKELFPGQLFVPTGGVEIEKSNIEVWFKAGVCAVGLGSKLIRKEILEKQDHETLFSLTTRVLEIVKEVRSSE